MATAKSKQTVQKSVTVGVDDNTVAGIAEAAKAVGAPDTARVSTGNYFVPNPDNQEENYPYSVTFIWTE